MPRPADQRPRRRRLPWTERLLAVVSTVCLVTGIVAVTPPAIPEEPTTLASETLTFDQLLPVITPSPRPTPEPTVEPPPPPPRPAQQRAPRALPSERRAPAPRAGPPPIQPIGHIHIPRIGLTHVVFEGIEMRVLDRGPGHWPGTARPGQVGNSVFPGHRVTNTRPFRNIDQLREGDQVIFEMADGVHTYQVTQYFVVQPEDVWIVDQTPDATFTIFACHPPGSARQRYVVKGVLVESRSTAPDPQPAAQPAPHQPPEQHHHHHQPTPAPTPRPLLQM